MSRQSFVWLRVAAICMGGWQSFVRGEEAVATAPAGTFHGFVQNGTRTWRGIPYAEPPVGDRRWKATVPKKKLCLLHTNRRHSPIQNHCQPLSILCVLPVICMAVTSRLYGRSRSSPLSTKVFGATCAQLGPGWPSLGGMIKNCHNFMHGCPNVTWGNATSEDCLYLNVYSPVEHSAHQHDDVGLLPVVVYFPSGAFEWGSSNDQENNAYQKAQTAGWKDVVFVSANYRTGIFGFLASESLSARSGDNSSGLFGIHDQMEALRWVQTNIRSFGGDPDRVMIFGESAGATSMSLHLVMSESAGLFHAVAIDSGAFNQWSYRSWSDALDIWENITAALGCDAWAEPLDCWLSKPTAVLLNVSDAYYGNTTGQTLPHKEGLNETQWGPVVDGVLLPDSPMKLLHEGWMPAGTKVPVLMGSNSDEGTTFLQASVRSLPMLAEWANYTFGAIIGSAVTDYYGNTSNWDWPTPSPDQPELATLAWNHAAQAVIGDFVMWCPARSAAKALATQGHDVFLYDFIHQPAESVNWPTGTGHLGAFHGAEVPFVFGDTFELVGGEMNLSVAMATYWTNMASSGDPNIWKGPRSTSIDRQQHTTWQAIAKSRTPPNLGPEKRPANYTFWWQLTRYDCGGTDIDDNAAGMECEIGSEGYEKEIQCEQECSSDPHCGGVAVQRSGKGGKGKGMAFRAYFRPANCSSTLLRLVPSHNPPSKPATETTLLLLRDYEMPRPPEVGELPPKCNLFSLEEVCLNISDGYRTIPVNVSIGPPMKGGNHRMLNTSDLGKCCAACLEDGDKCKYWFVPTNRSDISTRGVGSQCVLVGSLPHSGGGHGSKGGGGNMQGCVGAVAPSWIPPPQCHNMFQPFRPGQRVEYSEAPMHLSGKPTGRCGETPCIRTVLPHHTEASCCEACYLDYEGMSPCSAWEWRTVDNTTTGNCTLFGSFSYHGGNLHMLYNATHDPNFRGAVKRIPRPPPLPPPPATCATPTVQWPRFSSSADGDVGLQLDICNISVRDRIKTDRCNFWHGVVDQYWEVEKWIPETQPKVRTLMSRMAGAVSVDA